MTALIPRPRRLSRTLARSRWAEYRDLLRAARTAGYRIVALEDWARDGIEDDRVLVLRHDVDQHPRSALVMAAIERDLGIQSTWYFRWRTADPGVVGELRASGASVGLHYETLSRLVLELGRVAAADEIAALVPRARTLLREEIEAFAEIHGPIRSICAHGDTRAVGVRNADLLRDQDPAAFGVEIDASEAMRGRRLAHWLTDRAIGYGRWVDGLEPERLLAAGASPLLLVVHPNNWVSGPSLWADRLLAAAAPVDPRGARRGPLRTGVDVPPL